MSEAAVASPPRSECSPAQSPPAVPAQSEPLRGIHPSELIDDYAHERVERLVRLLARKYHLREHLRDDLRQDLYTAICNAANRYDAAQASRRTYVARVVALEAIFRARSIRNERQSAARSPLLLSDLQRRGRCPELQAPRWCEPSALDLVLDLRGTLDRLGRREQILSEALKTQSVTEIAAESGRHRSTVHRSVRVVRGMLAAKGLNPAD